MKDVIIVGLGAMGSAAAARLAESGHRVLAFDTYTPPHTHGSSHGLSRIFREAYWEDPRYVELLPRARELWKEMGRDAGRQLLHITGALMIAPRGGSLVTRSAGSAQRFGVSHEILSASELKRRWPQFEVNDGVEALLEHNAGYLVPEECVELQINRAARAGAELRFDEKVLEWSASPDGVSVRTSRGVLSAEHLVVTTGPWAPQILENAGLPLRVTRQVVYWIEPREHLDLFREGRMPIYLIESEDGQPMFYGFPLIGSVEQGVKIAIHGSHDDCSPETVSRSLRIGDEQSIRARLAGTLPSLAGRLVRSETCLYTMTPDENFVIGPHPQFPSVTLAVGFSGHGFKFAPVVGEIVGELVETGGSRFDIDMFSPSRFLRIQGSSA